jgi:hypothetical protein
MTVVGKILVFLNLIFSLAVGAFAVMSYTASSNHAKGFDELDKRYKVVTAASDQYKKENEQLREQHRTFREVFTKRGIKDIDIKGEEYGDKMAKRVGEAIAARDNKIKSLEDRVTIEKNAATKSKEAVDTADGKAEASTDATQRREKEVKDMRVAMGALAKKNGELAGKLSTAMDERVQALLRANTLEEHVRSLEENQRELVRELQRARTPLASRGGATPSGEGRRPSRGTSTDNPPLEQAEGRVTAVKPGGLVSISIGRDSGLQKGNTLHIFRLGNGVAYVGKIVLLEVEAKQAVGQIQGRLAPGQKVRVKDTVASSILGGN